MLETQEKVRAVLSNPLYREVLFLLADSTTAVLSLEEVHQCIAPHPPPKDSGIWLAITRIVLSRIKRFGILLQPDQN